MNKHWLSEFRERMDKFSGAPSGEFLPLSIKVRVESGCFHREHSPHAYELIDEFMAGISKADCQCQFEEHESGPEILVILAVTAAGLNLAKSVIDLITAIIKARSEGIKKGDGPSHSLEVIIRGHYKEGEYFEEKILRVSHNQVVTEKIIEDALAQSDTVKKYAKKVKK